MNYQQKKKNLVKIYVTSFALMLLFGSVFMATTYRSELKEATRLNNGIIGLLNNANHQIEGKTCGILTEATASEILGGATVVKDIGSRQGVFEFRHNDEVKMFWADSCQYEDTTNSNSYIEFQVSTYQSEEDAIIGFTNSIPKVNDAEVVESAKQDLMIYDSGVMYSLKGRQVVQVSVNDDSNKKDSKEYAILVHATLLDSL